MKTIHIVPTISNEASGPSYSVVRLCESLFAEGREVTLTALDWVPMESPPPFFITFPLGMGPRRLGRSPRMYLWLKARAREGSVGLMHSHSLWMMPNVYPGRVCKKFGIPLVVSPRGNFSEWLFVRGSWVKRPFWPLVQKPSLAATTCFHATAWSEYEDIRRMGFRQPVAIIPNGIDVPVSGEKAPGNVRTLLFLGRIHPKKGLDILLPAWRAIQDRFTDWKLRVVGPDNGGHLAQMQRLANELGLKHIEFCGPLYGKEKWQAYRDAELFVLPTYSENFGMTVAEALAAGTPAIVSKGAPWEGLETHSAGRWIEIGLDPLVASLKEMLSWSPGDLMAMGQCGRTWMSKDYSWKHIAQQMTQTYHWLSGEGNRPEYIKED